VKGGIQKNARHRQLTRRPAALEPADIFDALCAACYGIPLTQDSPSIAVLRGFRSCSIPSMAICG